MIFVSYARLDEPIVAQALSTMNSSYRGVVWRDIEEIQSGALWWKAICKAIEESHSVFLWLSEHSLRSRPCRLELRYADALKRDIYVVNEDGRPSSKNLPNRIAGRKLVSLAELAPLCSSLNGTRSLERTSTARPPLPNGYYSKILGDIEYGLDLDQVNQYSQDLIDDLWHDEEPLEARRVAAQLLARHPAADLGDFVNQFDSWKRRLDLDTAVEALRLLHDDGLGYDSPEPTFGPTEELRGTRIATRTIPLTGQLEQANVRDLCTACLEGVIPFQSQDRPVLQRAASPKNWVPSLWPGRTDSAEALGAAILRNRRATRVDWLMRWAIPKLPPLAFLYAGIRYSASAVPIGILVVLLSVLLALLLFAGLRNVRLTGRLSTRLVFIVIMAVCVNRVAGTQLLPSPVDDYVSKSWIRYLHPPVDGRLVASDRVGVGDCGETTAFIWFDRRADCEKSSYRVAALYPDYEKHPGPDSLEFREAFARCQTSAANGVLFTSHPLLGEYGWRLAGGTILCLEPASP